MIKKFSLFVGLNDKDTKKQRISTIEAYKIIENVLIEKVGGGSIFERRGIHKHESGEVVIESTLNIELYGIEENQAIEIISILKIALNQESIILQTENVNSKFV